MKVVKLPEGITQEMIDEAKAKHGNDKVKFIDQIGRAHV